MVHLLAENELLEEDARLKDALRAFWDDFVYRPSRQKTPGRQYMRGVLDDHPVWTTNDDDHDRARLFSPAVFLGGFDDEHLVELPAIWAAVDAGDDIPAAAEALADTLCELGVPSPHYTLYGDGNLYPVWRIEPLRRPAKKAPLFHYAAFKQCLLAWQMARTKLALALEEKLERPCFAALLPLPHPSIRSEYLDSDAYVVDADPAAPTLRIRAISQPLGRAHDLDAWQAVRPHHDALPRYLRPREAWVTSDRFVDATQPKRKGERHPAALTITCVLRWAGWAKEAVADYLCRWHERNLEQHAFPDKRPASDEIRDLVDWAFKKLVPGGPDRRPADDRGRYTARHDAIAAVLSFLTEEEAHLAAWYGTQHDLAASATFWAAARGHDVAITRDSLQKLLPELADLGVLRVVEREGRTWITRWALRTAYSAAPTDAQPEPPPDPPGETFGPDAQNEVALPDPVSQRQMHMSIRRPEAGPSDLPQPFDPATIPEKEVKPQIPSVTQSASTSSPVLLPLPPNNLSPPTQPPSTHLIPSSDRRGSKLALGAASRREGANLLLSLGFSVIPLRPSSKLPFASSWSRARARRATRAELDEVFATCPDANVAVVTGELSGVVVVDLDSDEALRWASDNLPPTPLRVCTGRGEHWYYRHPHDGSPVPNRACLRGLALDVKADGGYVVAPGSKHPDGHTYEPTSTWTKSLLDATPRFDRAWLLEEQQAETPDRLPDEDDRAFGFRQLRAIREALKRRDWRALRTRND